MTKNELDQILKRKGYSIEDNDTRLRPTIEKRNKRSALVSTLPREEEVDPLPIKRLQITFTVYSVRPGDWDNYYTKYIQDGLVNSSILRGDQWDRLQGRVISEKVHEKEQERTEVEINEI